jgi:hypothetical protein
MKKLFSGLNKMPSMLAGQNFRHTVEQCHLKTTVVAEKL